MTKNLSLLGSTGSIGTQSLDVARKRGYRVRALSAFSNVKKIEEQIREFKPGVAALVSEDAAKDLKDVYVKKVRQLIDHAKVKSITVLVMEVPCCMGLVQTVREALSQSELKPPVKVIVVGLRGNKKDEIML